ncbi:MAG: tyrosine-type recombinase/integrase [Thermodesulfobacteriota bacterium]|nr:tyrosine-type recombinase/integrase [Thermodesulfobacteriota bacterium]
MPKIALNAHFVNTVICPEGKKKENYYDTSITGFILEVRSTGGKTYAVRYRDSHNRQCQHKIGDSKSISFDRAKKAAQVIRSRVVLGEDPSAEKRKKRMVPTLAEFCRDRYMPFIKGYKRSWKSDDSLLRNHILPRFGTSHLDKITPQAVTEFHHSMKNKGYALGMANRGLVLLKYMFNLCLKWKIPGVESNPAAGVKLFEANNARERFLTAEENQRLCAAVKKSRNSQLKNIVPLLLLLGCRKMELLKSQWSEFDLERRIWRIPLAKSGKSRHVPLSQAALAVLAELPRWDNCPYVVPNPDTFKPFVNIHRSWDNARKTAGLPEVRMHDLRHSMASNMVNSGRSIYEVANVLGHAQLKTTQRYAHLSQETLLAAVDAAAKATGLNWGKV